MRRVRGQSFVAAVAVLVALAGCGGGDKKESSATTTTPASTPTSFTGEGSEAFCSLLQANLTRVQQIGAAVSANPAEAEPLFQEAVDSIRQAAEVAPAEIKADATKLADGYQDLVTKLGAGEIEQTAFLTTLLQLLASTRLIDYTRDVCHIPI